jgi:hypothetical protein
MRNALYVQRGDICHELMSNLKKQKIADKHPFPQRIKTSEIIVVDTQGLGPLNSNGHRNGPYPFVYLVNYIVTCFLGRESIRRFVARHPAPM